ncbi:HprK-related kinase A [Alteromonas sp. W364]|jgi:HprK-related kinase A|uniref:HprK-related kinase A n=1 Tax=Alteromonas sp. W364 TaxID=3075610 RepID=UPI00288899DE|nr:HprK-related kinase A [Alteromonas sp. W364]MDT0627699.1 HprK-related kinase A [Alteromonas sp. W364]
MKTFQLSISPFVFQIETDIPLVLENAKLIYQSGYTEDIQESTYVDYFLSITFSNGLRRFFRPQARFLCDDREPFKPLHANQAFAMLEWGMNWTVAAHELDYAIVHSAVLAKDNKAILFPAPPGSGKSTLTAHLSQNGWRLLSDEMALIQPKTNRVRPFVRPVCLKNSSIELAKAWFPDATYSSIARHTHKGDVIHMAAPSEASAACDEEAEIVGIVYPNYKADTTLDIYPMNMTESFMQLVSNSFNFTVVGNESFDTITQVIEQSKHFEIFYNDLNEVSAFLDEEIIHAN